MSEQTGARTLRVLHLPPGLSDERREELFRKYGAIKIRTIRKSKKYTITFAEFPSEKTAEETLKKLHQLSMQGRRLSIEFANRNVTLDDKENADIRKALEKEESELSECRENYKAFLTKLNNWAPHHLFIQPVPPNLRYKYPVPTRTTLLRIAIQLIEEPAFYTQVLHLMNKMNLPPPFDGLEEQYPFIKEVYNLEKYRDLFGAEIDMKTMGENIVKDIAEVVQEQEIREKEIEDEEDDDEESEWESDKEADLKPQIIIPEKRKLRQSKKRLKIPKFINPSKQPIATTSSQKHKPEEMFELRNDPRDRKIVLKTPQLASQSEEKSSFVVEPKGNVEGFGLIFPAKKDDEEEEETKEKTEYISTEELHNNKISEHDQELLPVFKNYHPGKPSNRLYLKNLAKQVEEKDLHFIYRRYVLPSSSESETEYNIRLMQEGRMKGQAFVVLPNVAQAQLALKETNGYILKEKPMVVQFAKVSKN